jgi:ferredoxin-NADP reductase
MIIIINNNKYDITEFVNEHPGGNHVFVDGKDMTEEFNSVGHSKHAIKMLEKYKLPEEKLPEEKLPEEKLPEEKLPEEIDDDDRKLKDVSIYDFIKYKFNKSNLSKLFTRHDYLNIHKILGTISLINMLYFLFDLYYSGRKGICTIRKFDFTFFILLIIQLLLSLSSLQFHIPPNMNYTTISISEEYRMQSILFVIRHFLIICVLRFIQNKYIKYIFIAIIFVANLYCIDLSKIFYKQTKNTTGLIGSMPLWYNCNNYTQRFITDYYSMSQISISYVLLTNISNIEINYLAIFIIQLSAFMGTLSRKHIINNFQWHFMFLLQYFIIYYLFFNNSQMVNTDNILTVIILWIFRTKINITKYFLWGSLIIYTFFTKLYSNNILLVLSLIVLYLVLNHYNMIFDKKRTINHNIIISNEQKHDIHFIDIKLKDKTNYKPGQYYNIYVNKEKKPYTPISIDNDNIIRFFIKNYKNNKISEKICSVKNKSFIHVDGPFGLNYYDKEKDVIMYKNNSVDYTNILMFYCGTGITPFYSMITNLTPETKYKYKLFGSLRTKKEKLFKLKHKIYYPDNKINIEKINKIITKYDPENTCLFICGTDSYQQLFSKISNYKIYKW